MKNMQNEPNLKNTQINVTTSPKKDYMKKMPSYPKKTNPIQFTICVFGQGIMEHERGRPIK